MSKPSTFRICWSTWTLFPTSVFETSPYGTVRYDAPTLRPATNAPKYNLLVSNLRTDTLYALDDDSAPLDIVTGRLSRLIELDPNGFPTTNLIKLSREIPLGAKTGFFAGADSIVVVSDYTVRRIDVRSGWVIDLGSVQLPSVVSCENGF